ncbi:MAG TPA: hypothetical protein VEW93_07975 [Acidimicrobiales bacterium]|nr:hypothetical protein [Acidimicrobiales bacterium]
MTRSIPARARLVAVLVGAAVLVSACGGDDPSADPLPSTGSTAVSTADSTTTAPPSTEAPTTPSTTGPPPSTEAPPPATATVPAGAAPVAVMLVGDSVGYTIGKDLPAALPGVRSVDNRALVGCGLLTTGDRPPEAVALGVPATYDGCVEPIEAGDAAGLAAGPDVILLVTGAWERSEHVRDGRPVGPGDPAWTQVVRDALRARVQRLGATGVPVGLWVDPCGPDEEDRRAQAWYRDEVVAPVAEETAAAGTFVVDPAAAVCAGDRPRAVDGVGDPRPEDGQHWSAAGAAWLWTSWLGPTLAAGAA